MAGTVFPFDRGFKSSPSTVNMCRLQQIYDRMPLIVTKTTKTMHKKKGEKKNLKKLHRMLFLESCQPPKTRYNYICIYNTPSASKQKRKQHTQK